MKKVRVQDAVGLKLCHDIPKSFRVEFKGGPFAEIMSSGRKMLEKLLKIGKEHNFCLGRECR
jgi:hypothetical protein